MTNVFHPAQASLDGSSYKPLSSRPASVSARADNVVIQQAVENSRRYKDYLMKQSHVRRSFQKQMEKKIAMCPYPKTFRQVWPVVPVHDPSFVRNFGLEAIFLHLGQKNLSFQLIVHMLCRLLHMLINVAVALFSVLVWYVS